MTNDSFAQKQALSGQEVIPRFFAVISSDHAKVDEIVACFAEVGDRVETEWYATPQALLDHPSERIFDAVIFYALPADGDAGQNEQRLRAALGTTAFFRVAA